MKNNRVPVSEKHVTKSESTYMGPIATDDSTYIDPELEAELKSQNLHSRWLNIVKLKEEGGFDKRGYVAYKRKNKTQAEQLFGANTEGYVQRGTKILGVLPMEQYLRNKGRIDARNAAQSNLTARKQDAAYAIQQQAGKTARVFIDEEES
jgi:hypothetical protein